MQPTILFRADAGPETGYGHFVRTLALAEMLKHDFNCQFATAQPTDSQRQAIEKICPCIAIKDRMSAEEMVEKSKGIDIVVLDNYYFTSAFQKQIKEAGCKLVCIDDLHDKHFYADAVINQAIEASEKWYSGENYTQYYLGLPYALLRSSFLSEQQRILPKKYASLVMMGGSDPEKLVLKISRMLKTTNMEMPVAAIVGENYQDTNAVLEAGNTVLFQGVSGEMVSTLMQESCFGILPASTSALEACAVRLPFICGYFVENQHDFYHGIQKNQLALCVGDFTRMDSISLARAIQQIQSKDVSDAIVKAQTQWLDKKSGKRFIELFKQL